MNCSHCGAPVEPGNRFCLSCGQPIPLEPAPTVPKKKNIPALVMSGVSFVLAVLLVLSLVGVFGGGITSKHFATPEAAIQYFVKHMTAGDWEGALTACAVNEIAENYDYEDMVKRLNNVSPSIPCFPPDYEQFIVFNKASLQTQILKQMAWLTFSVTLPDKYEGFLNDEQFNNEMDLDEVVEDMDPAPIAGLKLVRIDSNDLLDEEDTQEVYEAWSDTYGVDAMTSRMVLYKYDNDYYVGSFQLVQFNDGWLVYALYDYLSDTPLTGALVEVADEDEYEHMLG